MKFILQISRVILLTIIGMGFVLQGCINDDRTNCFRYGVTIDFIYDYNEREIDEFRDVVENVDLYIYDKSGALISEHTIPKSELAANGYQYDVTLGEGKYDIVAWMNLTTDYKVSNKERIDMAQVNVIPSRMIVNVGYIDNGMSHIYHGMVEADVKENQISNHTISFIKDTKTITVNAVFDKELPATDEITVKLTGTHGLYDFYNSPVVRPDNIFYRPAYFTTHPIPEQVNTAMYTTVQRLWDTDDVNLAIVRSMASGDVTLVSESLTWRIMDTTPHNTNLKLDKVDNLHIEYFFTVGPGGDTTILASITINGWVVVLNDTPIR